MLEKLLMEPIAEEKVTEAKEAEVKNTEELAPKKEEITQAKSEKLADILRREKEAESTGEELGLSEEELDIYDEYVDGTLKLESKKEESKEKESEKQESPKEITDLMSLTGAKDAKDLLSKVKDLTNHIANKSKDAEFVSKMSSENADMKRQINSEKSLMQDLQDGKENALEFMEKNYGLVPTSEPKYDKDEELDPEGFLDDKTAKQITDKFSNYKNEITELKAMVKDLKQGFDTVNEKSATQQANNELLTESYEMALQFEKLKDIPNLKNHVHDFLSGKNTDEKFTSTIGKVFDEVKKSKSRGENLRLDTAFKIIRADESKILIKEAENKGRKSAYQEHQPSNNLSDFQKGGDSSMYRNYTDDEIAGFEDDSSTMPDSLFTDDGDPLPKDRLSKKLWKLFGYK